MKFLLNLKEKYMKSFLFLLDSCMDSPKWSKKIKNSKPLVLMLVSRDGYALGNITKELKELKSDKDVVMAAVSNYGLALRFASDQLKADKEVVIIAVSQNGDSLYDASKELQNDREVVMIAVSQDGFFLYYASKEVQNDKEYYYYWKKIINMPLNILKIGMKKE
jgi:hypothetical protein